MTILGEGPEETEETKRRNFFKVVIFFVEIVADVLRKFLEFNLQPKQELYDFLVENRHALYHLWLYNIPCCDPDCEVRVRRLKKPHLCLMHLETLYNIYGPETEGHELREKGRVLQHCICKVKVKSGIYIGALDLTTCYSLLTRFFPLTPENIENLKRIIVQEKILNKHLNEKMLSGEMFKGLWDELQMTTLLIATSITEAYANEMFEKMKSLSKTTPTMKRNVKCYESYLEWFSKDDILRQEKKHAKRCRVSPVLSSIQEDQDKSLTLIEVIMVDLVCCQEEVETAVERLPPDGMETADSKNSKDHKQNTFVKPPFVDPIIKGANTPKQPQLKSITVEIPTLKVTDEEDKETANESTEIEENEKEVMKDQQKKENKIKNDDVMDQQKQTDEKKEQEESKDNEQYETELILEIPAKSRWQNVAIVRQLQNQTDRLSTGKIDIKSISVRDDDIRMNTGLAKSLFVDRPALREELSESLHAMFKACDISDSFSVQVVMKIIAPDGIGNASQNIDDYPSKFIMKDLTDSTIDHHDDFEEPFRSEGTITPISGADESSQTECQECKAKEEELARLNRKVKSLELQMGVSTKPTKCKQCRLKDLKISALEQDGLKRADKIVQQDKEIVTLKTEIEIKNAAIKTYRNLEVTSNILDKETQAVAEPKHKKIAELYKKYAKNLFYTRPTSEPVNVFTRFPHLATPSYKTRQRERPVSEHVFQTPKLPGVSTSNKKYLISIGRISDYIPPKKTALRYSNRESRFRDISHTTQPMFPPFPSSLTSKTTDKSFPRPFSVKGKAAQVEQSGGRTNSKRTPMNNRRKFMDLHLDLNKL